MVERLSTGFRNFLLGKGSARDFLADSVMKIYSGAAPASANDIPTGVLLATVSLVSGTTYLRPGWGEVVNVVVASTAAAHTFAVTVVIGTETTATSRVYTNTPQLTTIGAIAVRLSKLITECGVKASPVSTSGTITCIAPSRQSLTIAAKAGITGSLTFDDAIVAKDSAGEMLNFGPPALGALPKTSAVWSALVAVSGVAGYFRFVQSDDSGASSLTEIRAQGDISTSGAELNLSNTSLVAGTTLTIDSYSFSLPAE